jgi:hypothetical protein
MGVTIDCSNSYRVAYSNGSCIAAEDPAQYASLVTWALRVAPITGKSIAWIGGGFAVGPRLFTDAKNDVYEIEPGMQQFCPKEATFILGDYQDTLRGTYDVIIYDLGGDTPEEFLSRHLNPGGVILPAKE